MDGRKTSIPASVSLRNSAVKKVSVRYRDDKWHAQPLLCPASVRNWLCDHGSLTERIQKQSNTFRVHVVNQNLARPSLDEQAMLDLRPKELGIVREVQLCCDGIAVVFAHSVLAKRGLQKSWRLVSGLGNRSLGAALFANPRIRRQPLRFKKLNARDKLFHTARKYLNDKPLQLWARRSIFLLKGQPLLVTEIFLPAIAKLKQ